MKKITFALIALLFVSGAFAQQFRGSRAPQIQQEKNTVMSIKNHSKKGIGHATSTKAVIWTNNFNTPAEWTMNHTAGFTGDWVVGPGSGIATSFDSLLSTSGGNIAWFNSDILGSGTTNEAFLTYTGTINCTGHTNIQLVFNQYYTRYKTTYNETVVQVSADGTTWTDYPVNSALAANAETSNPNAVNVNITATAANQAAVHIRFKYKSAWGYFWQIDDLSVEDVVNNDIAAQQSFVNMNGWDYFTVVPVKQLDTVYCAGAVKNLGLNAQTNVVLNLNVNGGAYTGASPALASLASGVTDTLWTGFIPTETVPTAYEMAYAFAQTQTDENLTNNIGDTTYMYSDASEFWRSFNATSVMSSYSFGAGAPATSGMEYGATYHFKAADQIDSIIVPLYKVKGTPSIQGKLYTVNTSTNAHTLVASTAVVSPAVLNFTGSASWVTLGFTTPYTVAADEYLSATIAITGTMTTDTLFVGSDGAFAGDASIAGDAYLNDGSAWGWYTYNGVPTVGIKTHISNNATLSNLTTGGATVAGFASSTYTYNVVLPYGTTVVPTVTGIATDANATVVVTPAASLPGATTVVVTAQDGTTQLTYTINYTIAPASNVATLSNLTTGGTTVTGFVSGTYTYNVELPFGTTVVPTVTGIATDANATVVVTPAASLPGATTVVVTAQDGTTQLTYTINYTIAVSVSTDATLSDLTTGGTTVTGFASSTYTYNVVLPYGTTVVPAVTATTTNTAATKVITLATSLPGSTTVVVTAQDGTTQLTYTINYTLAAASTVATLSDLTTGGTTVTGFASGTYTYNVVLPAGTTVVPTVTGIATDANATVVVTPAASLPGATTVVVTAQDGTTQLTYTINYTVAAVQTYTVTFSVVGTNGTLAATVDAAAITSPATVVAGKNVVFTAAPATNYQVKEWKLNNVVVAGNVTNTYTLSTLAANSTVTVEFELAIGINEVNENVVSIYPNPANDVVNVKMNTTINKIEVVSLNGQIVAESLINNNEGSINISTIANGMYFLRIETANGITMNKIQISK
jgi:hypothetical protein